VEVIFGAGSVRETLAKISAFTPFSLLLGVLLLILWTTLNRLTLSPLRLALALLGLSLGFSFGGVLTGYLPPLWVERLGAALALLSLGRTFLPVLLLVALAPLTFLSVRNAGLLLGILAAATLVLLLRSRAAAPQLVKGTPETVGIQDTLPGAERQD
jgi:hypothetical protein